MQTAEWALTLMGKTRCLEGIALVAPTVETRAHKGPVRRASSCGRTSRRVLIFLERLPVNHDDRGVCRARFIMHECMMDGSSVVCHSENFQFQQTHSYSHWQSTLPEKV